MEWLIFMFIESVGHEYIGWMQQEMETIDHEIVCQK